MHATVTIFIRRFGVKQPGNSCVNLSVPRRRNWRNAFARNSEWVKNMVGGESDLSGLDKELDSILFSDRCKGIRSIWRKVSISDRDILWNWFLPKYCGVFKKGVFDADGKLEANAENEFNLWIERNLPRVGEILEE